MGVTKCVLFFKLFFRHVLRRVAVAKLIPTLWITSLRFICATVQVGGTCFRSAIPCPHASPAHNFRDAGLQRTSSRTGLYTSDMSSPFARLSRQNESYNLQICEVINALADSDPDLFDNETATLMPVEYHDKLDIAICDAHLNSLTPYDAPTHKTATTAIVGRMHRIARWHGALQANFERELFGAPLSVITRLDGK